MSDASQTTSDFKGDHLSVKMYSAKGESRQAFDGAITIGTSTLTATLGFSPSDVGKIITIPGAGLAGANLISTIVSTTDSTHATIAATASVTVTGVIVILGTVETDAITGMLIPPDNPDGKNVKRRFPTGLYLCEAPLSIPNPHNTVIEGWGRSGSAENTTVVCSNPDTTGPIVTLGDGTFEPADSLLDNLSIDANSASTSGTLYLNRINLAKFRDLSIQNFGKNGIGIGTPVNPPLFQEIQFDRVSLYGTGASNAGPIADGTIGADLNITGNTEFFGSNVENIETAIRVKGSSQAKFCFIGGRVERCSKYAFILDCVQPFINSEVEGAVWLSNSVINGDINLGNFSGEWATGALVDNGFGNRIRFTAAPLLHPGDHSAFSPGTNLDGDEWLYVDNLNSDPTFINGTTGWTGTSSTLDISTIVMPGIKWGKSLKILSTAPNGYAEKTFTASTNTDYLLQVGLSTKAGESYRVAVYNGTGLVWDSGNFTYPEMSGPYSENFQAFRVIRKNIPVTSDTTFKVRIYSVANGQTVICPLLLIGKSELKMATDKVTIGAGFSSSGSGPNLIYSQDTTIGSFYTFKASSSTEKSFFRCVVTTPPTATGCFIGVAGDGNSASGGPQVPLIPGRHEYTIPLSSFPASTQVLFYSFINGGTIQVEDIGIYRIQYLDQAKYLLQEPYHGLPNAYPLSSGRLYLPNTAANFGSNWQSQPTATNQFVQTIFASNIYWDETSGLWKIDNLSTPRFWAAMVLLNTGDIGFACDFDAVLLPSTLTPTQFLNKIRYLIPASDLNVGTGADATFAFFNKGRTEQWLLCFGSGSPVGVINASTGNFYIDITNGKAYLATFGGTGGWQQMLTSGGVVTSVGLSLPSEFTVTGSPVTTTGTLTANWLHTSWTNYTATITPGGLMTFSGTSQDGAYWQIAKTVFFRLSVSTTVGGTPSSLVTLSLPITPRTGKNQAVSAFVNSGGANAEIVSGSVLLENTTTTFPAGANNFVVTGCYEAN